MDLDVRPTSVVYSYAVEIKNRWFLRGTSCSFEHAPSQFFVREEYRGFGSKCINDGHWEDALEAMPNSKLLPCTCIKVI